MSVGAVLVRIRSCCCCRILHPSLQNTNSTISFSLPPLPKHRFSRSSQVMSSSSFSSFAGRGGRGADMKSDRERSRGRGGRGGGAGGSGMDKIDALGRLLTRILRHMASELSLNMRNDGNCLIETCMDMQFMNAAQNESTVCAWLLNNCNGVKLQAVSKDNKQRFGLLEEDGELLIRANQGHTLKVVESESLLRPILSADEVPVCVHGTYRKNLDSILQSGLKRMERLHVHFSCGLPTDGEVISGMRKNINVIIFLDVKKALEDGMKLYISENKVILTEGFDGVVPVKYFEKIEAWPSRKCIPLQT
ncbi:tRNA 2'-phosphotransferase 1 [Linum perenne]